jgi:D-alanyl-D-alanine dipeptidase
MIFRPVIACLLASAVSIPAPAADDQPPPTESDFVDVRCVDRTIVVDLRYASANNFMHCALYPENTPPIVRFSVAQRLAVAQSFLKTRGCRLKIWDAYRPRAAQAALWAAIQNTDFVADPREGIGSMHTRGVAVDVTLVDGLGNELVMPTDFDNFTPAAMLSYQGPNLTIRSNLNLLQKAMARAGFYGLRTEWWHFCAGDWAAYPPVPEVQIVAKKPSPSPRPPLSTAERQSIGMTRRR